MKRCRLCRAESDDLADVNLCVYGSEGIQICNSCLCALLDFARTLGQCAGRAHKQSYKDRCSHPVTVKSGINDTIKRDAETK